MGVSWSSVDLQTGVQCRAAGSALLARACPRPGAGGGSLRPIGAPEWAVACHMKPKRLSAHVDRWNRQPFRIEPSELALGKAAPQVQGDLLLVHDRLAGPYAFEQAQAQGAQEPPPLSLHVGQHGAGKRETHVPHGHAGAEVESFVERQDRRDRLTLEPDDLTKLGLQGLVRSGTWVQVSEELAAGHGCSG